MQKTTEKPRSVLIKLSTNVFSEWFVSMQTWNKNIENRMDKTAVSNASTTYFISTELHSNFLNW